MLILFLNYINNLKVMEVKNVTKIYNGEKNAVDNILFTVNNGEIFAFIGHNGAGKTTTIRMLLGIIKKDSGEITWNGKKVDRKSVNFGYLPEERGVYPKVKIYDQLMYFAELKGMKRSETNDHTIWNLSFQRLTKRNRWNDSFCISSISLLRPLDALDFVAVKASRSPALSC